MALPPQVQAALDAADATLNAVNAAQPQEVFAEADAAQPFEEQAPPPEVAPVAPEPPKDDLWEKKYRVLQGKYDAEVPNLHHKVRDLETNLRTAIERMNAASEAKERQPEPTTAADTKDIDNFGGDLVDMVSRVAGGAIGQAARAFEAKANALEQKIAQLAEQLSGTHQQVAMTAEQAFFDRVTKLVPNWEAVNVDPAFLAWLSEVDPVYGFTRQAALENAQKALNPDRASAVFQAFIGPQKAAPRVDPLANQVSPRSSASVAPSPTDKPVFTQAQVTYFYDQVRQGVYRGNEAEQQRIEQLINTALSEGRIR